MNKKSLIKLTLGSFLFASLLISFCGTAIAQPPPPPPFAPLALIPPPPGKIKLAVPPPGQVWIEAEGKWTLVPAPPADGPYVYVGGAWVIMPPPVVEGYEWVPGYYVRGFWYPGHFAVIKAPGRGMVWTHGHWKGGVWVGGHWGGKHPHGHTWVPGHRGSHGGWVKGGWHKPPRPHRK